MGHKVSYSAEDIESLLTMNSKQVIEKFLTHYSESSHANFRSGVYRLLYEDLSKDEVSDINYQDYIKLFPYGNNGLKTQEYYRHSFFKFLYVYDHLKAPKGFEKYIIKSKELTRFQSLKEKKSGKNNKEKIRKTLNIEELTSIQQILNVNSTKLDTLKMQFVWFAVFELGIEVEELKKDISSDNYFEESSELRLKNDSYKIPEKYALMFKQLNEGDRSKNGFSTINYYFEKLGNLANLEKKLLPRVAKATRKDYMVTCGNCENQFTNLVSNWLSVNGRIICIDCADLLKKKTRF